MKNKKLIIIVSLVLIIGLCGVCISLYARSNEQKHLVSEVSVDSSDDTLENVGNDTITKSDGTVVMQLGDEDLLYGYIPNSDGSTYMFELDTVALKANTTYRIEWAINANFKNDTGAYFSTTEDDGVVKPCVYLNTSYKAGEGLGTILASQYESALLNNSWEFTTENEGDMVAFIPFKYNASSASDAAAMCKTLYSYILECKIIELEG